MGSRTRCAAAAFTLGCVATLAGWSQPARPRVETSSGCYLDVAAQNNFNNPILVDIQHSYIRLQAGTYSGDADNYKWYRIERTSNQNIHGNEYRRFRVYSRYCKQSSTDFYEIKFHFTWNGETRRQTYRHPGGTRRIYLGRINMLFEN